MIWFEIKTPAGSPESMGIAKRLKPPFVRLPQHVEVPATWVELVAKHEPKLHLEFFWGTVTYQRGENGNVEKACYWYDTSD
jgi:hypothetical protein